MPERKHTNRLIDEKSPYLLQHATNPVEWYPWGSEAIAKAVTEEKPIFLSVGYSTCHWCHVMERESFEDERTAGLLNNHFVPVKVDREEMPDLDHLYMLFVQATTGRGGWPMSVWLTPSLKPFFGGSYFPPDERWGMPSFTSVLKAINRLWENDRDRLVASAGSMMQQMVAITRQTAGNEKLTYAPSEACLEQLTGSFDPEFGGFGGPPKFPRPVLLSFLFSHAARTGNRNSLDMALLTLRRMADGGIHDQLGINGRGGGGFARYSTDEYWHLPHFEKMLYDNAQLAETYLKAWQWTHDPLYADAARDIFNYVLCDMTSPEGGFYAAEDADSVSANGDGELREGAFYLWSKPEVMKLLGERDGELFCQAYAVMANGNAPTDPHGEFRGLNILTRKESSEKLSTRYAISPAEVEKSLAAAREKLFETRCRRPRPRRDHKVITAWNGLMISALSKGARILDDPKLLQAARRAATFILDTMHDSQSGRLLRRYCDGEAAIPGKAADYASLTRGLIDLYEASFDNGYLRAALKLTETQISLFYDRMNGGFFSTACDDALIPLRLKESEDGAEPSASSISTMNLLRLAAMTGGDELRRYAEETLRCFSGSIRENPAAMPLMLAALDMALSTPTTVILAGAPTDPGMKPLLDEAFSRDRIWTTVMQAEGAHGELLPFAAATGQAHKGPPAAYVCMGTSCYPPIDDPEALAGMLAKKMPE
jgi:hypothetical protein